jgi:hypothetical protein
MQLDAADEDDECDYGDERVEEEPEIVWGHKKTECRG